MMPRCPMFVCSLVKTAAMLGSIALAATPAAPTLAATTDPFQVLYIFPGVRDNGGADNTGAATVVFCYSFSSTAETIQNVVRGFDGTVAANTTTGISPFQTITTSTHINAPYTSNVSLHTGVVAQGILGVLATSPNMVCTAQVINASDSFPTGIDLHGMRLNPLPGVQE